MTEENRHGGARPGSGRKPGPPRESRIHTVSVRLNADELEKATDIGEGKPGQGLRIALEKAPRPAPQEKKDGTSE